MKDRRDIFERDLVRLRELGFDLDRKEQSPIFQAYLFSLRSGDLDHLDSIIPPHSVAIDIGANAGQFALKLSTLSKHVIVIEPLHCYSYLKDNLPANCTFLSIALGMTESNSPLNIPLIDGQPNFALASFLDQSELGQPFSVAQNTKIRRLDDVVAKEVDSLPVGFIKIDVEGWESKILAGAKETIEKFHPNFMIEIWERNLLEIWNLLEPFGYRGHFYFQGEKCDLTQFDPAIHTANEKNWNPRNPDAFENDRYVKDFFFLHESEPLT